MFIGIYKIILQYYDVLSVLLPKYNEKPSGRKTKLNSVEDVSNK